MSELLLEIKEKNMFFFKLVPVVLNLKPLKLKTSNISPQAYASRSRGEGPSGWPIFSAKVKVATRGGGDFQN